MYYSFPAILYLLEIISLQAGNVLYYHEAPTCLLWTYNYLLGYAMAVEILNVPGSSLVSVPLSGSGYTYFPLEAE